MLQPSVWLTVFCGGCVLFLVYVVSFRCAFYSGADFGLVLDFW